MPQEFPAIRLVALDLDGTLLNREGHVTPRTRAALQAAVDKGVYIVPATGRPLASLPPEVAQLPGIRYVITCNGAAVWDLGSDPVGAVYSRYSNAKEHRTSTPVCLLHSLMPVETAREAFAVCESCHADLRIFSDGYACTDAHSIALAAARAAKKDGTEARQPNDGRFTILRDAAEWMSRNAFAIEKLCVFFETPQQAAAALPRFRAVPGVEIVQGSPKNVEVTAAGVDKGEALRALADRLGVPHECTLAVGDSENDRAMLQKAGVAAVMANGIPEIRALAHLVSKADCDHDAWPRYWKPLASEPVFAAIFQHFYRHLPDFSGHSSFLCNVYKLLCKTLCLLSITKDGLFVYTSTISAYGGIAPTGANPTHRESSNIKGEMRYESHRRKGLSDRHYPCYRFQQR